MDLNQQTDQSAGTTDGQITAEPAARKPYTSPKLTHFGQMNHLTRLGGGDNPNDGDNAYGSPVS
jgi:hypothetical protein